MAKRDLKTKELALMLHVDVAEARRLKALDAKETGIAAEVSAEPLMKEDPAAKYCRTKTDGTQFSIMYQGKKYCTFQKKCLCHVESDKKAKFCRYKG